MTYTETTLRMAVRYLANGGYIPGTEVGFLPEEQGNAFAWISAGMGEIQVSEDGSAWWLRFDRTHAVAEEEELSPIPTESGLVLAGWMAVEAQRFKGQVSNAS